jgi:TatD DNase family protein
MNMKKNYLVDTHCHLNIIVKKEFDILLTAQEIEDAQKFIDDAKTVNVKQIVNVATSLIESKNCATLAKHYAQLFAAIGIHPNDLNENWKNDLKEIIALLDNKKEHKIVAIGETGIDTYRPGYNLERQRESFIKHIELGLEHDLPIIIHTRAAPDETLKILKNFKNSSIQGIIHCFPYDKDFAKQAINLNFKLGIGGTITYPNSKTLQELIKTVPLEHIVLETDAPFLAPQKQRGKQNVPAYIPLIAKFISELRNEPLSLITEKTTENARQLFKLPLL